jgi:hypothetical protein
MLHSLYGARRKRRVGMRKKRVGARRRLMHHGAGFFGDLWNTVKDVGRKAVDIGSKIYEHRDPLMNAVNLVRPILGVGRRRRRVGARKRVHRGGAIPTMHALKMLEHLASSKMGARRRVRPRMTHSGGVHRIRHSLF